MNNNPAQREEREAREAREARERDERVPAKCVREELERVDEREARALSRDTESGKYRRYWNMFSKYNTY
jgi:muconolactone delta-isomerase